MNSTDSTETSRQVALDYLQRVSAGDIPSAMQLVASTAEIWFPDKGYMNRTQLGEILEYARSCFVDKIALTPSGVTSEGERVAVEVDGSADLNNGGRYENRYHFLFIVQHGQIVVLREYLDTVPAQQAFWS